MLQLWLIFALLWFVFLLVFLVFYLLVGRDYQATTDIYHPDYEPIHEPWNRERTVPRLPVYHARIYPVKSGDYLKAWRAARSLPSLPRQK